MGNSVTSLADSGAFVAGAAATFDAAVAEAARTIRASALPAIGHIGADIEGAREAVRLAEVAGGVLDHAYSEVSLKDLDPVRESGAMQTTPLEARVRADLVVLVGGVAAPDWLAIPARPHDADIPRRVLRLGPELTGAGVSRLAWLAALRARAKGAPSAALAGVEDVGVALRSAKFGVAIWDAAELEPLALEALHCLVRDLNETTRFSTLATPAPDHGEGVQTALGWMTGYPARTSFARGFPEHDPWRYDSRRLIASGESDCLIWISALPQGAAAPPGAAIVLGHGDARVRFDVAAPGVETDAILHDPRAGALIATCAAQPPRARGVAEVLAAIRAALESPSC